jgi:hypothetical protein
VIVPGSNIMDEMDNVEREMMQGDVSLPLHSHGPPLVDPNIHLIIGW